MWRGPAALGVACDADHKGRGGSADAAAESGRWKRSRTMRRGPAALGVACDADHKGRGGFADAAAKPGCWKRSRTMWRGPAAARAPPFSHREIWAANRRRSPSPRRAASIPWIEVHAPHARTQAQIPRLSDRSPSYEVSSMRDDRPKRAVVARSRALYGYEGRARLWGKPLRGARSDR